MTTEDKNNEIRLYLSSPKNEEIAEAVEKWIEKHYLIKVKLKIDVKYSTEIPNDKECPLNGKLNEKRRCSLPKWYPGFIGKFELYCKSQKDLGEIDEYDRGIRFKRVLFGENKTYEKYRHAGLKEEFLTINCIYTRGINKGSTWMFGELYFFLDDFPILWNNISRGI